MKTSILKKSLLDYAIKGNLSSKFRKSNPSLNVFDEINAYNAQILKDKKSKEKELKEAESKHKIEKDKELKQILKSQIQTLKKEIAKLKTIAPLNADSAPFVIPPTWVWVRLGEVCEINPRNQINDELEVSFIPMALIANSFQNRFTYESKKWKEVKSGFSHLCENSVAFAKITPCFENGKSFIVNDLKNGYGAGTTELIVLLPQNILLKEYLFYFVNCPLFVENAMKNFKGTAGQQRVSTEFVTNFLIPLPPLEEQKAIVETLDSLITLANTFDKTKEELKRIEKKIEKSLLQYAILGKLSSKFRKSNPNLNAFNEINAYNAQILKDKKSKEKALKELESKLKTEKDKEAKQTLKQTMQNLKKDIAKLKTITPLFCNSKIKTLESQSIEKSNFQYNIMKAVYTLNPLD